LTKNLYKILGIDKAAKQEDIKKAYRALSMEHHPDKGGDEEKFKVINEAYSVLSDPKKREAYDNPASQMGGFPFGDIFGFASRSHPGPPNPNAPRRGRNIVLEHPAPLHYFIFGGKLNVKFSFRDACPDCGGTGAEEKETCANCKGIGQIVQAQHSQGMTMRTVRACPKCMGRGFTASKQCTSCNGSTSRTVDKDLVLDIPKAINEGHVVGAAGEGHIGINGAQNGDLIVKLHIQLPKAGDLTEEQRKILEEI